MKSGRLGRQHTVNQTFHVALDPRKRRAQLVGDIADQFQTAGFRLLQAVRHLVEAERQPRQFIQLVRLGITRPCPERSRRDTHPLVIVPIGDALAGDHHLLDGQHDPPADEQADRHRRQKGREACHDQRFRHGAAKVGEQIHAHAHHPPTHHVSHGRHVPVKGRGHGKLGGRSQDHDAHQDDDQVGQEQFPAQMTANQALPSHTSSSSKR